VCPGAKVTVDVLPPELLAEASEVRYGGGGFNSCSALRVIAPETSVHYLDACHLDDEFRKQFENPMIEFESLELRQIPDSAIVDNRESKVIFKSPINTWAGELTEAQMAKLAWLSQSEAVLANSVKDTAIMSYLADAVAHQRVRLYVVLTQSLAYDFVHKTVLPSAHALFTSWDQVSHITNSKVEKALHSNLRSLAWLQERAPNSHIFLTMGKLGTLVVGAGQSIAFHLCLKPLLSAEVQVFAAHPSRVCGCGDAFAAGVLADLEAGQSLLTGERKTLPPEVWAGLAGCAAALHWLGYQHKLCEEDFTIRSFYLDGDENPLLAA
jgi:sugar/nucleoside kinase (ribokinase family)